MKCIILLSLLDPFSNTLYFLKWYWWFWSLLLMVLYNIQIGNNLLAAFVSYYCISFSSYFTFKSDIDFHLIFYCILFAGKTYRIRVHNVGISTTLNFRIQNHNLLLVETEGYYTTQRNLTNFDIHAGQSYSFLLSTDQNASTDYYIVASARFVNESFWQKVKGVAVLHYTNSKGAVTGPLPPLPDDVYNDGASMNQARSVRFVS